MSAQLTDRNYSITYKHIKATVGIKTLQQTPQETISIKQRQACKALWQIRKDALSKWKEHLNNLLIAAKQTKNKNKKKLIMGLQQAEDNQCCFQLVWSILKPRTGGLTHLLIPNKNEPQIWQNLEDVTQMEDCLLNYSQHHFQQAHRTPYTVEPLRTLLGKDGLSDFGDQIYYGQPIDPALPIELAVCLLFFKTCFLSVITLRLNRQRRPTIVPWDVTGIQID